MAAPRIRVMHVITGLGLGGAETMLYALATAPTAAGLDQSVVSLTPGGHYADRLAQTGVRVAALDMKRGIPGLSGILALSRLIAHERPDVVQGWMYHADIAAMLALWWSGRRRQTGLAWGLRASSLEGPGYGRVFRTIRRLWLWCSRCPGMIIANSRAGLELHRSMGMRARQARVIPNGIDIAKFHPDAEARNRLRAEWGIADDVRVLAHVARVDPIKDHGTFLAAMDRLPEARGILVGRDTEKLDRPPNVMALGQREDIPAILAAADIAVSSSTGEGFSNVLAEGMAAGLPAIATDVGDARLILADTGLLCAPRDPDAMARAIRALLEEPDEPWMRRREAARRRIVENFSLERAVEEFTRAYRDLLAAAK